MNRLKEYLLSLYHKADRHDIRAYLICVALSAFALELHYLNEKSLNSMEVGIKITDKPKNVVLLDNIPNSVNVSFKDKGLSLISLGWDKHPTLRINFNKYNIDGKRIRISRAQLLEILHEEFGSDLEIHIDSSLDSISSYFTSQSKRVPLNITLKNNIGTDIMYAQTGKASVTPDSVTVYGLPETLTHIKTLTCPIAVNDNNVSDTIRQKFVIPTKPHTRCYPASVDLMIPIEALVSKTIKVKISTNNVPQDVALVCCPPAIDLTYLVPVSRFKDNQTFNIYVDYNDLEQSGNKLQVKLVEGNWEYGKIKQSLDSVEYIIEKR